jgi:hypothetical protein
MSHENIGYHADRVPAKEHKQALAAMEKANKAAARSDAKVRALTDEHQVLTDENDRLTVAYNELREEQTRLQETVAMQNIKLAVAEARAEERAIAANSVLNARLAGKEEELARLQACVDSLTQSLLEARVHQLTPPPQGPEHLPEELRALMIAELIDEDEAPRKKKKNARKK